eukprot:NODE_2439_length_570_cov_55.738149_g2389_i0.p1 GENE.NODE_2439_length_570_cov_55.738149_g2389_i0~~NODE_2439_length_570_cov_55.738149_g2389_i0.p1  ORF type:complete len:148 (-),score=21.18 NODE_2439_length_570_cov_55.738149_g2389_i0:58-501(-)
MLRAVRIAQRTVGRQQFSRSARLFKVYYTESHEWIDIEGDKATLGITDYAQEQMGDLVYIELPEPGATFDAGDVFGSVESTKTTGECATPVAGTVAEVNTGLGNAPEMVNQDAEGSTGWMIKLNGVSGFNEGELMDRAAYDKYLAEQ